MPSGFEHSLAHQIAEAGAVEPLGEVAEEREPAVGVDDAFAGGANRPHSANNVLERGRRQAVVRDEFPPQRPVIEAAPRDRQP